MTIRIECDSCFQIIKVKDELAGRQVRCPDCQNKIRVPAPGDQPLPEPELPPVAPRPKASGQRGTRAKKQHVSKRSWGVQQWPWLVALALLLVLLVALRSEQGQKMTGQANFLHKLTGGLWPAGIPEIASNVSIRYQSFTGTGTPSESAGEAMASLPGYVYGSGVIDEKMQIIRFIYRGRPAPGLFMPVIKRYGFHLPLIVVSERRNQ